MCSGSCRFRIFWTRSGTTWLIASLMLPESISTSPSARLSPIPTQLKGRTIVYGRRYWSQAARAKYSTASFWKPYDDSGGGTVRSSPSFDGQCVVDSKTIDEDRYVIFCSLPSRRAAIAASHDDAMIRSLVASRSYAYAWKYE